MKRYIQTVLGRYYRTVITPDYVFYTNYQESDENGQVMMFTKGGKLVSDNYFAYSALMDIIYAKSYTYVTRTMKQCIDKMLEANPTLPL